MGYFHCESNPDADEGDYCHSLILPMRYYQSIITSEKLLSILTEKVNLLSTKFVPTNCHGAHRQ